MAAAAAKCSTVAIVHTSQASLQGPGTELRTSRVVLPCQAAGGWRVSSDCAQLLRPQNDKVSGRRVFSVINEATQTKTPRSPAETEWKIKREALLKARYLNFPTTSLVHSFCLPKVRSVSPKEALKLQQEQGYTIIDVRPEFEYNGSHPAGAVNIQIYRLIKEWTAWDIARRAAFAFFGIFQGTEENPDFINEVKAKFDKDSKIILGCIAGGTVKPSPNLAEGSQSRSLIAAYLLTLEGYTNVIHIEGGIRTWFKDELPTEAVVEN